MPKKRYNAEDIIQPPLYPDIDSMDRFNDDSWHATRWNHDVDLRGKRVIVTDMGAKIPSVIY